MKKTYIFSFLLIISASNIFSQSGWFQLSSPTNRTIYSVFFNCKDTGYIGTDSGKVYKTINGGTNWILLNVPSTKPVGNIKFVNPNIGYLICYSTGQQSTIFKSSNGGMNWYPLPVPYFNNPRDLFFLNMNTGYIANLSNILKTTDGGITWDTIRADYQSNGYAGYNGIFFKNSQTGFVVGDHQYPQAFYNRVIWKTVNEGLNWTRVNTLSGCEYMRISFLNDNTGYCVGGCGSISKTTDGGNTWYPINLSGWLGGTNLSSINIRSENRAFICGRWGFYNTSNGGVNWSLIQIPYESYLQISFPDDSTGYVVGDLGRIYKTTNGGNIVSIQQISSQILETFSLHQNYPNPFNPVTKIKFQISLLRGVSGEDGRGVYTRIIIYDLLGREVTTLVNEQLKPGSYEASWDGTGFASGVYFYSLVTNEFTETKRMVLIK